MVWKKHRNIKIIKNSKTWAHKVKLWSTLWKRNRVAFQGDAATKKFKQKER